MHLLDRSALFAVTLLAFSAVENRAGAQTVDPCKLVTRADAARILKSPAIAKAKSVPSGDGTCAYADTGFDVHTETLTSPGTWAATVREMIEEKRADAIRNIGDEAVFLVDRNRDYEMTSRKGTRIVTITMYKDYLTLADAKQTLVELLTLAMSRVH
jgi:hypothetical protein